MKNAFWIPVSLGLLLGSANVLANADHHPEQQAAATQDKAAVANGQMPMMQGMGGIKGMPMMDEMQKTHARMMKHMEQMEMHMANIEAYLKTLVERGQP